MPDRTSAKAVSFFTLPPGYAGNVVLEPGVVDKP